MDVQQGGDTLRPDLATALPEVSADGLTYTFHIKSGLDYGPPFQTQEITSQGFMNALEREADPAASAQGYAFYYAPIQGFNADVTKETKDESLGGTLPISGVTAPDPHARDQAHRADRRLRIPHGDGGDRSYPRPAERKAGLHGTREGLRSVPRAERSVHVRGKPGRWTSRSRHPSRSR